MEEKKQMLELLEKIEKTNRRQLLFTQIFCGIALVAAIFCIVALVKVGQVMPQIQEIAGQMQSVLGDMEQAAGQLAELDMGSIVGNVEALVGDVTALVGNVDNLAGSAQESLKQTMTKLNTIDFETLNKAIEDLSAVVQPLADFFGIFSR